MPSTSSSELSCWENKDFDAWIHTAGDFEGQCSEATSTSFFDLNFDYDNSGFVSSDASAEFNFFDDFDLGSTSTDASVLSSAIDGHATSKSFGISESASASYTSVRPPRNSHSQASTHRVPIVAPIPQSRKLVHRWRPEGLAISNADLLSIEGRKQTPPGRAESRPKTPPATPQHRSGAKTLKAPRTPGERSIRVQKAKATPASMRGSPRKAMHPSNYYASPERPGIMDWNKHFGQFTLQQKQGALPLSPPPSSDLQQAPTFTPQQRHARPMAGSPTPNAAHHSRRMSSASPMTAIPRQRVRDSIEVDAQRLAPLAAWTEAASAPNTNEFAFSPLSPVFAESQWDAATSANSFAHLHNSDLNAYLSSPTSNEFAQDQTAASVSQSFGTGGLMIDFGESDNSLSHAFDQPLSHNYAVELEPEKEDTTWLAPTSSAFDPENISSFAFANTTRSMSRSPTPSPRPYSPSKLQSQTLRAPKRRTGTVLPSHTRKSSSPSPASKITATTTTATSPHRRGNSGGKSTGISKPKPGGRNGAHSSTPGDMFVNFTPSDSRRILTGVAPSGSSKTKARREKEAREERRRMSEAARKAVMQAGGDWEGLIGGAGVEV